MSENVATFMAVTGAEDIEVARRFLDLTAGDLDYAVTLFLELGSSAAPLAPQHHHQPLVRPLDSLVHKRETLANSFGPSIHDPIQPRPNPAYAFPEIFNTQNFDSAIHPQSGIFNQLYDTSDNDYIDTRTEFGANPPPILRLSTSRPSTHLFSSAHFNREVVEIDDDEDEDEDDGEDDEDDVYETHNANGIAYSNAYGNAYGNGVGVGVDNEDDEEIMNIDSDSYPESEDDMRSVDPAHHVTPQQRLAHLFRPPFDIMHRISLDQARALGKRQLRWVLVNLQDPSEFQCQVVNRDLWSNQKVKALVREHFILLQFPQGSPSGDSYLNFYQALTFPHIAILDPLTGERVKIWENGRAPDAESWCRDVARFLAAFSLDPGSNNPIVHHNTHIDPDTLSEEQQIALALKQSMAGLSAPSPAADQESLPAVAEEPNESDPFDAIEPLAHVEPSTGAVTRIQFRFPNGKRLIHKFGNDEKVVVIIQWLKSIADLEYGLVAGGRFVVYNSANRAFKFAESLDITIDGAGLKNASVLVEQE